MTSTVQKDALFPRVRKKCVDISLDVIRAMAVMRRKPFPWDLTWYPTYACNLCCTYCNSIPGQLEAAKPEKAISKIISLAPSSISILGGEPFILPKMNDYIKILRKALPHSFILVTTNGMVKTEVLLECLSFVNTLCVSIDGIGEYQRKFRQGNPERIIRNIEAIVEAKRQKGYRLNITVNAVVTSFNCHHLKDFFTAMHEIDPHIICFAQGMQPFSDPRSIGAHRELVDSFIRDMISLKKKGIRIQVVGRLGNYYLRRLDKVGKAPSTNGDDLESVTPRLDEHHHVCYQERFNAYVSAGGRVYTCRLYAATGEMKELLHRAYASGHFLRVLALYWRHFKEFVLTPPTFTCHRFYGCPEWMNDIISTTSEDEFPPEIFRVAGRLSSDKILQNSGFIQAHINPHFSPKFIQAPPDAPELEALHVPEPDTQAAVSDPPR